MSDCIKVFPPWSHLTPILRGLKGFCLTFAKQFLENVSRNLFYNLFQKKKKEKRKPSN